MLKPKSSRKRAVHVASTRIWRRFLASGMEISQSNVRRKGSPSAWQNHLAQILQDLNMTRFRSEPNVYMTQSGTADTLVYVDGLLFVGWLIQGHKDKPGGPSRQQHPKLEEQGPRHETCWELAAARPSQLHHTCSCFTPSKSIAHCSQQCRNSWCSDQQVCHYEISLINDYATTMLVEAKMSNCKPSAVTTTANLSVNKKVHALYRKAAPSN